jgi:hypothetical protein
MSAFGGKADIMMKRLYLAVGRNHSAPATAHALLTAGFQIIGRRHHVEMVSIGAHRGRPILQRFLSRMWNIISDALKDAP